MCVFFNYVHLLDNVNHIEAHQQAIFSVLRILIGYAGDAVVAVAEQFYAQTVVFLIMLYKSCH